VAASKAWTFAKVPSEELIKRSSSLMACLGWTMPTYRPWGGKVARWSPRTSHHLSLVAWLARWYGSRRFESV